MAASQSGTVRYDQATRLDFQPPPGMARNPEFMANLPKNTIKPMQLQFNAQAALFSPAPQGTERASMAGEIAVVRMGGGDGAMVTREISGEMMQMGRAMGFFGGGAGDAVSGAFTDLSDESYVEVREFLGRTFRIPEERPSFAWRLTGEAASFLGYPVYQAIATQDSTTIEAWFTPDIPVPAGPAQYGGLPGLILTLAVDSNRVVYTAKAIDLTTAIDAIKAPSEGSKVTRAEYDKIVAEKQEELSRSRRGRRNQ
jgi:GLPGLI family protein